MASIFPLRMCINAMAFRSPIIQQIRTTFVLKRRHTAMLSKRDEKKYKRLRTRHFIYDLVEDTNLRKHNNIDVILTRFVEGLGECGDIVSVKPHYARNELLLPELAVYSSPDNLKKYTKEIEARKLKVVQSYSSQFAPLMMRLLSKKCFAVTMSASEPWIIEPWHIKLALRQSNVIAPESSIKLPDSPISGPDSTKQNKEFAVFIKINKTETVPVRFQLHHLGVEINELWYYEEYEALLDEQKVLLGKMPRQDTRPKLKIS